jgi:hypothetical protein
MTPVTENFSSTTGRPPESSNSTSTAQAYQPHHLSAAKGELMKGNSKSQIESATMEEQTMSDHERKGRVRIRIISQVASSSSSTLEPLETDEKAPIASSLIQILKKSSPTWGVLYKQIEGTGKTPKLCFSHATHKDDVIALESWGRQKRAILMGHCSRHLDRMLHFLRKYMKFQDHDMVTMIDPIKKEMEQVFAVLGKELEAGDSLLLYYSGYGLEKWTDSQDSEDPVIMFPIDPDLTGPLRESDLWHHLFHQLRSHVMVTLVLDSHFPKYAFTKSLRHHKPIRRASTSTESHLRDDEGMMAALGGQLNLAASLTEFESFDSSLPSDWHSTASLGNVHAKEEDEPPPRRRASLSTSHRFNERVSQHFDPGPTRRGSLVDVVQTVLSGLKEEAP